MFVATNLSDHNTWASSKEYELPRLVRLMQYLDDPNGISCRTHYFEFMTTT
jgi:hypothetical protein